MSTNTYVALATQTLGSAVSSVTFSSIPQGYTDLRLVMQARTDTGNNVDYAVVKLNNDATALYSRTEVYGDGASAGSGRASNFLIGIASSAQGGNTDIKTMSTMDFMNYSNSTTYKSVLYRETSAAQISLAGVGLYRSTSAISTITLTPYYGTWQSGSTFTIYGIAAQPAASTAKATGGTITYDAFGRVIHTFTSSGTFTPSEALAEVEYLVVAGGGGGGTNSGELGGGGGAGGARSGTASLAAGTGYSVTVGAGGGGGTSGSNSTFSALTSTGGGRGGNQGNVGISGGSGGGGANQSQAGGSGNAGGYTPVEGYAGGSGGYYSAGGGGGAGAVGANAGSQVGGNGGTGIVSTITGALVYYGGGGGGSANTRGSGGEGGGGVGASALNGTGAGSGTANTGGGGGGSAGGYGPGSGGSGVVIIRYQG